MMLFGYLVIWLFGYLVIWLFGYLVIWLFGYYSYSSEQEQRPPNNQIPNSTNHHYLGIRIR